MDLINELENNRLPDFANNKIKGFYEEDFTKNLLPYCDELYWCDSDSINVFNVIGTAHPDYIGLNWREFIDVGKRMKHNLSLLKSNPSYYMDKEKKTPTMYYTEIDGEIYVDGDGNHRSALAKFYHSFNGSNPMLHGVNLTRYNINHTLKALIETSQKTLISKGYNYVKIETTRVKTSRDDTASWMREKFTLNIAIKNVLADKEIQISKDELLEEITKLHKKSFFSWFLNRNILKGIL
jgi:hypothetical protein